jgi:hypothetical protein
MSRTRRKVTYTDAEKYLTLINQRWGSHAFEIYGAPRIVEDWDGRGNIGICWDGPYEWTFYSTTGSFAYEEREPEYGFRLPVVEVPDSLSHVFSEPYSGSVLMLYLD